MEDNNNQKEESSNIDKDSISNVNIDKFRDLDGVSIKKLNFGLWYLEHKDILRKILYVFLGVIGFVTWFSFFKTFGHYVLIGMNEDERLIAEMVQNQGISHEQVLRTAAGAIEVRSAELILNSSGSYDIVPKIFNPNKRYYSHFSYYVDIGNEKLGPYSSFILPLEEKFLIIADQELSRRPSSVKIEIQNNWTKIDGHVIKDWQAYQDNYIEFSVENKKFSNPKESNLSEKLNLSTVEFDILNNSAYSYYEVNLDILLYYRGKLVSVTQYPVELFDSGENRHINITWPVKVNRVDSIVVMPSVDITSAKTMYVR